MLTGARESANLLQQFQRLAVFTLSSGDLNFAFYRPNAKYHHHDENALNNTQTTKRRESSPRKTRGIRRETVLCGVGHKKGVVLCFV
jgi:hypothetical protein